MTTLQQSRYDQLLRRVADLKGPGSKVNDVLTELFPVIDVESAPMELDVLSGTRPAMGTGNAGAGGVGFFSTVLLMNPVRSGVIARVENIRVASGSILVNLGLTQNVSAANETEAFIDGRVFPSGTVLKLGSTSNNLAVGPGAYILQLDGDSIARWEPRRGICVLSPGTALSMSGVVADQFITVNLQWTERQAQPSELNL